MALILLMLFLGNALPGPAPSMPQPVEPAAAGSTGKTLSELFEGAAVWPDSAGETDLPASPRLPAPDGLPTGDEAAAEAGNRSAEPNKPTAPINCPLPLADFCYAVDYRESGNRPTWQAFCLLPCEDAAETLLLALRETHVWRLEEQGYLDLFGDAWGCVVSQADGQVLVITARLKAKYSPLGSDNPMVIRLVYLSGEQIGDVSDEL
ncbi:MAG: hypothetical protein FWH50_00975 [Coriobacteriia bacterium]|nr:hypothetical protein [Coriobacteriia bacterium]